MDQISCCVIVLALYMCFYMYLYLPVSCQSAAGLYKVEVDMSLTNLQSVLLTE